MADSRVVEEDEEEDVEEVEDGIGVGVDEGGVDEGGDDEEEDKEEDIKGGNQESSWRIGEREVVRVIVKVWLVWLCGWRGGCKGGVWTG